MIWQNNLLVSKGTAIKGDRFVNGLRIWPPERSKLSALYYKGSGPELLRTMKVLYLGAAAGTTVSFVSDYVEVVYAVEFSPYPMRDLVRICEGRRNIIPIFADAGHPERYAMLVEEVDILYQDVSQRDQADIAKKNLFFLKTGGTLILMLKTRCIDMSEEPRKICENTVSILEGAGMNNSSVTWLDPYHKDHAAIICKNELSE